MHLVTYAYSLKSNHERVQVQLEEPIYTKVTLRLISRLAWIGLQRGRSGVLLMLIRCPISSKTGSSVNPPLLPFGQR